MEHLNDSTIAHNNKCPDCGKYVSPSDGWYDREDLDNIDSLLLLFCDENCEKSFHNLPLNGDSHE